MEIAVELPGFHLSPDKRKAIFKKYGNRCAVCGQPFCSYFSPAVAEGEYISRINENEIVLLCPTHFRALKKGELSAADLLHYQEQPYNLRDNQSPAFEWHGKGEILEVALGHLRLFNNYRFRKIVSELLSFTGRRSSKYFQGHPLTPLVIDETRLFDISILSGKLFYTLTLFDQYNRLLLKVDRNLIVYCADGVDCTTKQQTLKVTSNKKIIFELQQHAPALIRVKKARFFLNGVQVLVDESDVTVNGKKLAISSAGSRVENSRGIIIGPEKNVSPAIIRLERVSRYAPE